MSDQPPVIAECEDSLNGCYPVVCEIDFFFALTAYGAGNRMVELLGKFRDAGVPIQVFSEIRQSMLGILMDPEATEMFQRVLERSAVKKWTKMESQLTMKTIWKFWVKFTAQ